jgi:glycosyltransferase involved in cell wall biosynthesis
MPAPAISVLMAVWRPHPRHFQEAVASVLGQSFSDFEFVIVEDPSDQSAADLLQPFNDPRIRHIANMERTGLIAQRNRTLAEAKADWVALLDADDVMEPDRLEKQFDFVCNHPDTDVLGSQLTIVDGAGQGIGHRKYPTKHNEILAAFRRFNAIAQPSILARRSALVNAGGYSFEFPVEDYDLWSRMAKSGARFANHPEALTRYRIGGSSKSEKLRNAIRLTREVKRKYWCDSMTFPDRVRYWGEAALLGLPAGFVEWLFRRMNYGGKP